MEARMLWLRALSFLILIPFTVLGVVPWLLLDTGARFDVGAWRWIAVIPLAAGIAGMLWCNWDFAARGRGTGAPYDPPRVLVVRGLYRYVRNPMYVSGLLIVVGLGLWNGALSLFVYAGALVVLWSLFVRFYEEPHLRRTFGGSYDAYCAAVPRWWPRGRPWNGGPGS
jgi:protein-S-isoprenylcysteine O-methyltransferase Ste14